MNCKELTLPVVALFACISLLIIVLLTSCSKPSEDIIKSSPSTVEGSAFCQHLDDPFYVDTVQVIRDMQFCGVEVDIDFSSITTQKELWDWKEDIYRKIADVKAE